MKNNYFLKNYLLKSFIVIIIFLISFAFINKLEFLYYNYQNNIFVNNVISKVIEKYPSITKEEIIDLLSSSEISSNSLKEYGINLNKNSLVLKNELVIKVSRVVNILFLIIFVTILIILYVSNLRKKDLEIQKIIKYLESINQGNYKLDIDTNTSSELSILKNEIYKITIMLKEQANILKNDKILLKTSLEDLSHQLKTPLTSISIMLENINDDNISEKMKKEFIKDIKREVTKINFLVDTLLKLAKFDANTIVLTKTNFYVKDLIFEVIKNVSVLIDFKNIKIKVKHNDAKIQVDFKWEMEALTNILKNCIEYSNNDSVIEITYEENKLYTSIIIRDYGKGMTRNDLKNIFKRFYKGKNSSLDSVGIGLSLAKRIIEEDNGYISCDSIINEGTTFTIKYMK